jgi:hypothetical protein
LTSNKLAEAIADVRPDGKIFWSEWMTVRGGAKRETELAAVSVAFELVHKVLAHFSVPCPKNQQAWQDYKKSLPRSSNLWIISGWNGAIPRVRTKLRMSPTTMLYTALPGLAALNKAFFPGTLIVPLEHELNGKPFYVNHPTYGTGYLHHGEMLYVPGNVLRGEIGVEMGSSIHYAPMLYVELNSNSQMDAHKTTTYGLIELAYIPRQLYPFLDEKTQMDLFAQRIVDAMALLRVDDPLATGLASDYAAKLAAIEYHHSSKPQEVLS